MEKFISSGLGKYWALFYIDIALLNKCWWGFFWLVGFCWHYRNGDHWNRSMPIIYTTLNTLNVFMDTLLFPKLRGKMCFFIHKILIFELIKYSKIIIHHFHLSRGIIFVAWNNLPLVTRVTWGILCWNMQLQKPYVKISKLLVFL